MKDSGWYNGYTWAERWAKYEVMRKHIKEGLLEPPKGPCALCGDPGPNVTFEYHDEDYSVEYRWEPPAMYCLCQACHRHRLHQRFRYPAAWTAFLAHVRRGGYASDLKNADCAKEWAAYRKAIADGKLSALSALRPYEGGAGKEWFARLSTDPSTLQAPTARPRP